MLFLVDAASKEDVKRAATHIKGGTNSHDDEQPLKFAMMGSIVIAAHYAERLIKSWHDACRQTRLNVGIWEGCPTHCPDIKASQKKMFCDLMGLTPTP